MTLQDLRDAAQAALRAQDELLDVWRNVATGQLASELEAADISLLRELIVRRIYPVNAFGLLAQADPEVAADVLLSRYLGKSVDPDTKFGGFEFELATMLDDLLAAGGMEGIADLVRKSDFAMDRLEDPRVKRVFSDVLQIETDQVMTWVVAHRNQVKAS
jgi:hypothetical protein